MAENEIAFYSTVAQVIPVLFLVAAIEARMFEIPRRFRGWQVVLALLSVTFAVVAVGLSLAALANDVTSRALVFFLACCVGWFLALVATLALGNPAQRRP